jgi:hypothetical protein
MIRLDRVSKVLGPITAVDAVTMEVATGEVCVLLGPSGSMKAAHPGPPPKPLILRCERSEPRRTHPAGAAPDRRCVLRGSALRASHLSMRRSVVAGDPGGRP